MSDDIIGLFKPLSEIPEMDTSYFLPWSLNMLYQIEPGLKRLADRTISQKRRRFYARLDAYAAAKEEAFELVGWYARDPRLRSQAAWDCFFDYILEELNI